jgi:hypothetical protein
MTAETLPHQARAKRATDQFVITFELSVSRARRQLMQSLARTRRSLVSSHAKAERRATAQRLYDIALAEAAGRYVRACDDWQVNGWAHGDVKPATRKRRGIDLRYDQL